MQPQRLPATARDRHYWPLPGGKIHSERNFLRAPVGVKNEIVHWPAFNQDMRIVGRKPMQVVDWQTPGKHVVILALNGERSAVTRYHLRRSTDNPEIAGFLGQDGKLQCPNQLLRACV